MDRRCLQQALRRKQGRDPNTPPWRHLGTSLDKYGRLRAALRRLAAEFSSGTMSRSSRTLARDLLAAATEPWLLKLLWDWACDPERRHERAPGNSGLTFAELERWDSRWNWCRMLGDYVVPMDRCMKDEATSTVPHIPDNLDELPVGNCYAFWHEMDWPFAAPYRRTYLEKPGSRKRRPVDVAESWDWLIGKAIQLVVRDLLTVDLPDSTIAYREGLGTEDALAKALAIAEKRGLHWWLCVDLKNAYGGVVHPRLEALLSRKVPCPEVVKLIMKFMAPGRREDGVATGTPRGLPQGSPLSPFLFNSFAAQYIDIPWQRRFPQWPLLRYADDFIIPTASKKEAREAHFHLRQLVISAGFEIQAAKTRLVNLDSEHLVWLGHEIYRDEGRTEITVPERSWERLERNIITAMSKEDGIRADEAIAAFFDFHGPAWGSERLDASVARLQATLVNAGKSDPQSGDGRQTGMMLAEAGKEANDRWKAKLQSAARATSITPNTAASNPLRRGGVLNSNSGRGSHPLANQGSVPLGGSATLAVVGKTTDSRSTDASFQAAHIGSKPILKSLHREGEPKGSLPSSGFSGGAPLRLESISRAGHRPGPCRPGSPSPHTGGDGKATAFTSVELGGERLVCDHDSPADPGSSLPGSEPRARAPP